MFALCYLNGEQLRSFYHRSSSLIWSLSKHVWSNSVINAVKKYLSQNFTPEVSLDVYTISAFVNLRVTDLGLAVKINCSSLDSLDMHLVLKAATCRIWNLTWLLKPPKSLNGSVLHHHCVWRFTVVFSGSVVLFFFFHSIKGSFFILLTRMQPLGVVHFWGCLPLKFELLHTLHTKWGPSILLSSSSTAHIKPGP